MTPKTMQAYYHPFPTLSNILNSDFDSTLMPLSYRADKTQTNVADIPRANVYKNNEGYSIELAAPGFSRDDFDTSVENGVLSIYVETEDGKDEAKNIRRREWNYTSFVRSFTLPETTNIEKISARYEAGILHVQIPIEKERNTRRMITIE